MTREPFDYKQFLSDDGTLTDLDLSHTIETCTICYAEVQRRYIHKHIAWHYDLMGEEQ